MGLIVACAGVLILQVKNPQAPRKFKIFYINSKYIYTSLMLIIGIYILKMNDFNIVELLKKSNSIYFVFAIGIILLCYFSLKHSLSLIPLIGISSCFYLVTELGWYNWMAFTIWLIIGLFIYFIYGIKHSKLQKN